ncbi:MAG TPA: AtaL-like protein [Coleofasciculaceae cyanobacterium]|jgi:hypothetical protein
MPKIEAFEPVDADMQTIWTVLLDRIEHPDRYLAGVDSFSFPEGNEDYALREVVLQGIPLRERITIDERQGEIRYELVDHPLFVGEVFNALVPPANDDPKAKPVVQFRMEWQPRTLEARALEMETQAELEESMRHAVRYVKEMAEHMEKTQAGQ